MRILALFIIRNVIKWFCNLWLHIVFGKLRTHKPNLDYADHHMNDPNHVAVPNNLKVIRRDLFFEEHS